MTEERNDGAAPAVVTVEDIDWDDPSRDRFSIRRLLQFMGPGILMSIAYVDPGNLESDLQVGAQAGYVLLWLLLLSTFMGLIVQMQAAKLGVVTGQHLAQHCRQQYPPVPRIVLWLMAEIAIIGSDVQEVIGSAIALALLSGGRLPLWAGVLLTAADSFALLFIERLGIRVLEGFFGGMVGVMVAAFGVMYSRAGVPVDQVVRGFTVPRLPRKDLPVAVALMGSLIMPHNIYLHSALVQTRRLGSNRPAAKREALTYFCIESALSLVVAVVINLFITAVFAAGFYGADLPDIGLQNAGKYLGETYGELVVYIWALGLLAAGQSSTMTGTYTGQFVMGGYLDLKVSPWARVALTRAVAIAPTLAVALLCGGGDGAGNNQLDQLNQGLNLLQSIQLPFALVPVLTFASSPAIMGEFANSAFTSCICWMIAGIVVLINGLAVYQVAYEAVVADPWVTGTVLTVLSAAYLAMVLYLAMGPQSQLSRWLRRAGCTWGWCGAGGGHDVGTEAEPLLSPEERAEVGEGVGVKADCGCCGVCKCCEAGMADLGSGKGEVDWKKEVAVKAEVVQQQKDGEPVVAVAANPVVCCCHRSLQREPRGERAGAVDGKQLGLDGEAEGSLAVPAGEVENEKCQGAGGIGAAGTRAVNASQMVAANGGVNASENRMVNGATMAGDTTGCGGCSGGKAERS